MIDFDYYELQMKRRPHVVLLRARVSCVAIPDGDKYEDVDMIMAPLIAKENEKKFAIVMLSNPYHRGECDEQ